MVGGQECPLRLVQPGCFEDGEGSSAEQLRSAHLHAVGEPVEAFHQLIVELHQDLLARHEHMVEHMTVARHAPEGRFPLDPAKRAKGPM